MIRAERALLRAARDVQKESRALGLPVIVWQNGKVVERPAGGTARRKMDHRNDGLPEGRKAPSKVEEVCGKGGGGVCESLKISKYSAE